jgi:hypothetical protein
MKLTALRSRLHRPSPAMVVALVALFVALGGTTYAATGGNFILGNPNSASSTTSLSAPISGKKALQLTNTSTGAGATALGLNVASGHPPFTVNSGTKVANLNADKLDGVDSTGLGAGILGGVATNVGQTFGEIRPLIGTSSGNAKGAAEFVAPKTFVVRDFAVKLDSALPAAQNGIDGLNFKVNGALVCHVDGNTDQCASGSGAPVTVSAGSLYSLETTPVNLTGPVPTVHFGWRATP